MPGRISAFEKQKTALDNELNNKITTKLRVENEAEKAKYEPSGKVSAGMLGKPLLEQVLKVIGVPGAAPSDYSLRLFKRGRTVEADLLEMIGVDKCDEKVEYRGAIGYPDIIHEGDYREPWEVKSIKNSNVKWLLQEGPNEAYKLQGAFYALALESPTFKIICVAADDYRTFVFDYQTEDFKPEINAILTRIQTQLAMKTLPNFEPYLPYHAKPEYPEKYSAYPDWVVLPSQVAMAKLEREYPDAFKKLTGEKE